MDIVLSLLLETVFEKLSNPVLEKFKDLYNLRENIRKLQQSLPLIQAFLDDAEKRKVTESVVEIWLSKLKEIAYDSEDLCDELAVEIISCERRSSIKDQVRNFLLPFEPSRKLFNLAKELRDRLDVLDEVSKEGMYLNFRGLALENRIESKGTVTDTGSFVVKSKIYGREDDKKLLIALLLPSDKGKTKEDFSIISVVGIGGIGKTTLARLVYKDEKVINYFNLKIWIYVPDVLDVKKLMIAILESANTSSCKLLEMDLLQCELQEFLCGKKLLLVLDNVWNVNQEEWDELKDLLQICSEETKIIVTTRNKKVADVLGTNSAYHLNHLHDQDCWNVFKNEAEFGQQEEERHPTLVPIGKRILQKCGGLPLATKILGRLLRRRRDASYWLFVEESEFWSLAECKSDILAALALSYNQLPLHLKRCFVFCSLIPKNCEIQKEKLIHIWMANGLIKPNGGNRVLEDIGDDYFSDLLSLSFFEEVEKSYESSISYYKMHNLVHDLAKSIGGDEFVILGQDLAPTHLSQIRHSSVVCNYEPSSFPKYLFEAKRLRTLLFLSPSGNSEELCSYLPASFIYLRVLDFSGSSIKVLPRSISDLKCLRYLDLSNTSIDALPDTICYLYCLQTLNLSGCYNLVELPFWIVNLVSLRHVNTTGCHGLTRIPAGIGKLIHLQTLTTYIVGRGPGETIAELNSLNIRGELNIKCLENVKDAEEAKTAKLGEKQYLHFLSFQWSKFEDEKESQGATSSTLMQMHNTDGLIGSSSGASLNDVEGILQCLEPNPNLKKLFIKGYSGLRLPFWNLPNLVVIVLINCRRLEVLPIIGKLHFLKTLCLQGIDGITHIDEDFYGKDTLKPFPSLVELTVRDFPFLVEWSSIGEREAFACLKKLIVDTCPNMKSLPSLFPSLEHLELRNCHPQVLNPVEMLTSPSVLANLTSLRSLIISSCGEVSHLKRRLQKLKFLEFLEINGCHDMKFLQVEGLRGLSSLQNLSIENCSNLVSLSSALYQLTSLKQLSIMNCPSFITLPDSLKNLQALRSLTIVSCPEFNSLPGSLQHITTLQTLIIYNCGLTGFPDWFGRLSFLSSLTLSNCKHFISFPEELRELRNLQHLSVQDCPLLESRLKNKRGKEWEKIAHIPHIYIGLLKYRR